MEHIFINIIIIYLVTKTIQSIQSKILSIFNEILYNIYFIAIFWTNSIFFSFTLLFHFFFLFSFLHLNFGDCCRIYWTNTEYAHDAGYANDVSRWSWSNASWNANDATKIPVISIAAARTYTLHDISVITLTIILLLL